MGLIPISEPWVQLALGRKASGVEPVERVGGARSRAGGRPLKYLNKRAWDNLLLLLLKAGWSIFILVTAPCRTSDGRTLRPAPRVVVGLCLWVLACCGSASDEQAYKYLQIPAANNEL